MPGREYIAHCLPGNEIDHKFIRWRLIVIDPLTKAIMLKAIADKKTIGESLVLQMW